MLPGVNANISESVTDMSRTTLADSPFREIGRPAGVLVAAGNDPYHATRSALSGLDLSRAHGKRVLLKPNAGRIASPGEGITTDPRVVAATIDALVKAGASVSVGESPITGVKALDALEATGIASVARERRCPVIDLDERPCVDVPLPDGEAIRAIKVCADVLEHDLVVSIPVMKIHMHTGVSLAVKNMKGCLWRRSKVELHMLNAIENNEARSLDIAITDMSGVLRPHLAVIDGTVGMEGLGPSAGKAKPLGAVVASADAYAADAVACRLMGQRAENIPHLHMGAQRGYGIIDPDHMEVSPRGWEEFGEPFEAPPENLSIEFPNVNILDKQSCSACQSTVLLLLQERGDELMEYFPEGEKINIAIGKGHEVLPAGTVCVGNCTACHRQRGIFIGGCPPVGSSILNEISAVRTRPNQQDSRHE